MQQLIQGYNTCSAVTTVALSHHFTEYLQHIDIKNSNSYGFQTSQSLEKQTVQGRYSGAISIRFEISHNCTTFIYIYLLAPYSFKYQ